MKNTEIIEELATQVNWGYNTRNTDLFFDSVDELYNRTLMMGWSKLMDLQTNQLQCVGLAFAKIAIRIKHEQDTMPSVSAENAYYCLVRNYKETSNRFVLPAVFSILQQPKLLKDKLISATVHYLEKRDNLKPGYVGYILGGNPYTSPNCEEFRKECMDLGRNIQFYVLSKIADLNTSRYCLPSDIPLLQPSDKEIKEFIGAKNSIQGNDDQAKITLGEEWMNRLFDECVQTLSKF